MSDEDRNKAFRFISEPILLFISSIFGYLVLYRYEAGYFSYFNLPASLIEVSLIRLAGGFSAVFIIIILLYFLIEGFSLDKAFQYSLGRRIFFFLFIAFILLFSSYTIGGLKWPDIIFIMIIPLFFFISELVIPLFKHRKVKGLINKYERERERMAKEDLIITRLLKPNTEKYFYIFIALVISALSASSVGQYMARAEKEFLLLKSCPELVVLRKCSNFMICSEFDRQKKELPGRFLILEISQLSKSRVELEKEKIGPLRISKKGRIKEAREGRV